jgi:hypothetical protein
MITIQPNQVFESEKDMREWLRVNIPAAQIKRTWNVTMLACEVIAPAPTKGKK